MGKLEATKELAETRYVIAHNPLQLKLYADRLNDVASRVIISEMPLSKSIDLACLKEYAAKVDDAASELVMALAQIISDQNMSVPD